MNVWVRSTGGIMWAGERLCRTEKFSWCHFAHYILHYNQFAIKNKQHTHFEAFTVLHFSWLIFTLPRLEEHFNANKNIINCNNIWDLRSVFCEWKCSKIFIWCSWELKRIRLKWLTATFLIKRNYKPADVQKNNRRWQHWLYMKNDG
jgi:hypothetical protein